MHVVTNLAISIITSMLIPLVIFQIKLGGVRPLFGYFLLGVVSIYIIHCELRSRIVFDPHQSKGLVILAIMKE